ncbi:MAG TPA: hypothetical protein VGK99_24050 [Acidobacteriota bacterium]
METTAVGFRVKSGWATAVLLGGPMEAPKVIDRRVVQLSDPAIPASCQPYHAALDLPAGDGVKAVARLVKIVERFGSRAVAELLTQYHDAGYRVLGIGLVVGSQVDPATIHNEHIRAHAEEGRLFRVVIENAGRNAGLATTVTVERQLLTRASQNLRTPELKLKKDVTALGSPLGGRWRAEEKAAALAAWMVLA